MEIGSRTPFSIKGTKIEDPALKKASLKLAFYINYFKVYKRLTKIAFTMDLHSNSGSLF
jgi:hypothetical protein